MARVDKSAKKIIQTAPSPTRNLVIILLFIFLSGWLLTATDASRVLLSHSSRLLSSALKATDTQDTLPAILKKDETVTPIIDDFLDYNDSSDTKKTSNSDDHSDGSSSIPKPQQSKTTTKSKPPSSSSLPCSESGYCSINQVETFKGDVGTIDGIQHLIKTTTYKHELILIAAGHGFGFELGMNLVTSFWKLGIAHIAVLADDGPACDELHAVYSNITCIWSTTPGKDDLEASDVQRILMQRFFLILRMVRLGVNVLNLDSDAYVYRDPYVYLKSPPFENQEIIAMRDIWGHSGSNTGAIYAQNIKPDSSSAWFLGEVVDRIIRTLESADWLTEHKPGIIISHTVVDQFIFDDVIGSAYAGQMIAPIGDVHYHDGLPEERRTEIKTATSEIFSWGNAFSQQQSVEYPDSWSELTKTDFQDGKLATMSFKIPSALKGSMVDLFDGKPLLPPRKNVSQAIMDVLASEGPMWPDPWTSTNKGNRNNYSNSMNGTFAFAPEFLISAWASRGNGGLWAAAKQVVAHIVFIAIPEWGSNSAWKQVALKATQSWNWEVTNAFHPNLPFPGTSTEAYPIPRVLVLAPGVLQYSRNVEEFRHMSVTLAKLASRLGRVLVAPEVPCDATPWVSSWGEMDILPWKKRYDSGKVMGFNAEGDAGGVDKPRCMWLDTIRLACMEHTLLPVDFDHMQSHLLDKENDKPKRSNTLLFDMYHPLQQQQEEGHNGGSGSMGMGMVARLTPQGFEDLVNQGKKREMADAAVVYVGVALEMVEGGSLTNVAWGSRDEERFNEFKDVCKWLEPPQNKK
jgi:hypothetical protein